MKRPSDADHDAREPAAEESARLLAEITECTKRVEDGLRSGTRRLELYRLALRAGVRWDQIARVEARVRGLPVSGPSFDALKHAIEERLSKDERRRRGVRTTTEVVRETTEYAPSTTNRRE